MQRETVRTEEARIVEIRRRLDSWRGAGRGRRIPEALWTAAAELARGFGVNPISRALRLNYYSLKRRAEQKAPPKPARKTAKAPSPRFVEVEIPSGAAPVAGCELEIVGHSGSRLTVRLARVDASEVATIARGLWSLDS
jgi:hypothetical protein